MGLCKCPKRKVTNQFCFEHRVNVCEFCLTSGHPTCIVKSYLHWLQDSDYNPICTLCGEMLSTGECIRLTCYDVFHWDCINRQALKASEDSKSPEITCSVCKANLIPSEKLVSPVADAVRKKLATVAWGRKKLGLPTMAPAKPTPKFTQDLAKEEVPSPSNLSRKEEVTVNHSSKEHVDGSSSAVVANLSSIDDSMEQSHVHEMPQASAISQNTYVREMFQNEASAASRRVPEAKKEEKIELSFDHDDDKYRRKGIRHWLSRLFRLRSNVRYAADDPNITFKRVSVIMLLVVLGFMTVILLLTRAGRTFADHDKHLDPKFNPNIRISDGRT
ncbi:zinc finger protein-like 1 homolog [Rhopilema esculentum]|uniref:zinc finger protein-like 1 homolog n=1 Tax=Rhopilema esculentum TaxID=499914 RepID=UPI0031D65E07|eukprot:gene3027-1300_t